MNYTRFWFITTLIALFFKMNGQVVFCPGSTLALIYAPTGFVGYTWTPPPTNTLSPSQYTMASIAVSNPLAGSVFTLTVLNSNNQLSSTTYTLNYTSTSISSTGASSTCLNGSSGSATVLASGSYSYTYVWVNSANNVVGTFSTASNLSAGLYTVTVSGSAGCGSATAVISVGSLPANNLINIFKPYCGSEAYLCPGSGSNFQWYNGTIAISAPSGIAPCYTVSNPFNGQLIHVAYFSTQGCHDSIQYYLWGSVPGLMAINHSTYSCLGTSIGSAVISITPATGSPPGQNTYSVFSIGSFTPAFSASVGPTFQNSFSVNNLQAGSYTVLGFDGSCKYNSSFTISNFPDNFTLSPVSATLCPGNGVVAGVSFTSSPAPNQYSYLWSPATWLAGTSQIQTIVFPVGPPPGSVSIIVYSVTVTPSIVNCPRTKTFTITAANPQTPSIIPIPVLCQNSSGYTVSALPGGGNFYSQSFNGHYPLNGPGGVISTTLAPYGINTFTYTAGIGTCMASSSANYFIAGPQLYVNPTPIACPGQSTTIQASGANSYTWNTGANTSSIVVTLTTSSNFTVIGASPGSSCTSIQTLICLVDPGITVSGNLNICQNYSTTLTAYGAFTYTWSNGSNSYQCIVQPSVTTTYTVSGTSQNCINQTVATVTVNPGPLLQISGPTLVCEGEEFVLSASGANTYTWNSGSNSFSISTYQWASNLYSLSANSASNSCTAHTIIIVNTSPCLFNHIDSSDERDFQLFPNPNKGSFVLSTPVICELIIFDGLGRIVYSKELQAGINSVETNAVSKGVYTIQIRSNGMLRHSKVLID
ncbi:MAG TPA: T9SS type A sorting domain-containing protein [Bacteroidia bacterium]|nr:T9SS type A sorting domain-containing protein [Bacteroidia bacterium]